MQKGSNKFHPTKFNDLFQHQKDHFKYYCKCHFLFGQKCNIYFDNLINIDI